MKKKILAMILVVAMVLSLGVVAYAEPAPETPAEPQPETPAEEPAPAETEAKPEQ